MPSEVSITDASGRSIAVNPPRGFDQPLRRSMDAEIDRSARLGVLFGLAFIAIGVGVGVWGLRRAVSFEAAEQTYERRRAELARRHRDS